MAQKKGRALRAAAGGAVEYECNISSAATCNFRRGHFTFPAERSRRRPVQARVTA
jgi:hypothetical protein